MTVSAKDILRYGRKTRPNLILSLRGTTWGPKLQHRGAFFESQLFIIIKSSHQDLCNEGSNFILSLVEVAQTWPFFDKITEITDFGLLQQSQNRARF